MQETRDFFMNITHVKKVKFYIEDNKENGDPLPFRVFKTSSWWDDWHGMGEFKTQEEAEEFGLSMAEQVIYLGIFSPTDKRKGITGQHKGSFFKNSSKAEELPPSQLKEHKEIIEGKWTKNKEILYSEPLEVERKKKRKSGTFPVVQTVPAIQTVQTKEIIPSNQLTEFPDIEREKWIEEEMAKMFNNIVRNRNI